MTAFRFEQLKAGTLPIDNAERVEFESLLAWERRSNASKRAVQTKRRKYKTWPTRANDHR